MAPVHGEYWPAEQVWQVELVFAATTAEYEPVEQGVQDPAPAKEYDPVGHGKQGADAEEFAPTTGELIPAEHAGTQVELEDAPIADDQVPAAQLVHGNLPFDDQVPAAQGWAQV